MHTFSTIKTFHRPPADISAPHSADRHTGWQQFQPFEWLRANIEAWLGGSKRLCIMQTICREVCVPVKIAAVNQQRLQLLSAAIQSVKAPEVTIICSNMGVKHFFRCLRSLLNVCLTAALKPAYAEWFSVQAVITVTFSDILSAACLLTPVSQTQWKFALPGHLHLKLH